MSNGFIGGWLSDKEQRQDLRKTSKPMPVCAAPVDAELPSDMGVAAWMQIENQAQQGACAGHARTSCLELGVYHQTKGTIVQLCRQFAYITAQMEDGLQGGDNGSTIAGNARAAEKIGTCLEQYWPYTGVYSTKIPQVAYDHAGEYRLHSHVECRSYLDVFNFLALGLGGVQIGVTWSSSFDQPVIESYRGGWGGGHSVSFLDWSPKKDSQGRRYIRLFNSWGKSWGENGTKLVSPAAIDQMLADSNTVMLGLSDMVDLKPRSVGWIGKDSVFA